MLLLYYAMPFCHVLFYSITYFVITCTGKLKVLLNTIFYLRTYFILGLKEISDSKCPQILECPYNAEPCEIDEDCSPSSICCKSPCGKVCTKQLFTGKCFCILMHVTNFYATKYLKSII